MKRTLKHVIPAIIAASAFTACTKADKVSVTVCNPSGIQRLNEIVELDTARLPRLLAGKHYIVEDLDGETIPSQLTYDGKLIFPVDIEADGETRYRISTGDKPLHVASAAFGDIYPERDNDLSWENDLVGFRAYAMAKYDKGERLYGYDLWLKRNTAGIILPQFYADDINPDNWRTFDSIRAVSTDRADEFLRTFSYHNDHGFGMDCYAVGPTLGAGCAALMDSAEIVLPKNYTTAEILDNGPLRFTARLTYPTFALEEDSAICETRLITLDAGSHLNKTTLTFSGTTQPKPIGVGIALHDDGQRTANHETRYIAYPDPTQGDGNGRIFIGCIRPGGFQECLEADGHLICKDTYSPDDTFTYYWGFGWDKADIKSFEAWTRYLEQYKHRLENPLQIKYE